VKAGAKRVRRGSVSRVVPVAVLARIRRRGGWGRAEVRALELAVARRGHGGEGGRMREASGRGGPEHPPLRGRKTSDLPTDRE